MERSLAWYCQLRFVSIFTLSYLTVSVGYSLLLYNLIFKSPLNFFYSSLKITISVSFTLSFFFFFFFAFNQLNIWCKLVLTSLFSFLIELLRHKRLVSSRKWWTLLRSFLHSKNRKGPKTDPWGMPLEHFLYSQLC